MSLSPEQPHPTTSEYTAKPWGRILVATAACLGMFLAALDTSVNVALPSMTKDLDADLQSIQWVIVAFIATQAALVMGAGSFADRFGLRPVYIFGAVSYLAAMFFIAFSPNLETVVGFRVVQALSTGCLYAVSPAIAASVFHNETVLKTILDRCPAGSVQIQSCRSKTTDRSSFDVQLTYFTRHGLTGE